MEEISPDIDIKQCCWFAREFNHRGVPVITRAQRIRYAVQAGLPDTFVKNTLVFDVLRVIKEHGRILEQLNGFTHLGKKTFNVDEDRADELANKTIDIFTELLQTVEACRDELHRPLEGAARDALNDEMISRTIDELDEFATHYTIENAHIDNFELTRMGPSRIVFSTSEPVDCELQYGSDGDCARGDGLRINDNYPLACEFEAAIATPLDLKVKRLKVDKSSFYE